MTEPSNSPTSDAKTLAAQLLELVESCKEMLKSQKLDDLNAQLEQLPQIMEQLNSLSHKQIEPHADVLRRATEAYRSLCLATAVRKGDVAREMSKARSAGKVARVYESTRHLN